MKSVQISSKVPRLHLPPLPTQSKAAEPEEEEKEDAAPPARAASPFGSLFARKAPAKAPAAAEEGEEEAAPPKRAAPSFFSFPSFGKVRAVDFV
jgi:hypothetical protein